MNRSIRRAVTGLVMALLLTVCAGSPPCVIADTVEETMASDVTAETGAAARQAFVYNTATGETLLERSNSSGKLYPASTTKLFSTYVALLYLNENDRVTAGKELDYVAPDASRAYIYENQILTVSQLVEAMLLPSGNDAAYVLACAAGRKIANDPALSCERAVETFVDEMNACARELGLTGSHFMNPDGFHVGGHYTCLADMTRIAQLALENPVISRYAATARADVQYVSGEYNTWYNTNFLLDPESPYYHEKAVGLKTGYTGWAGNCLVSAFCQDEGYIIIGVFGCETQTGRFEETLTLAAQYVI